MIDRMPFTFQLTNCMNFGLRGSWFEVRSFHAESFGSITEYLVATSLDLCANLEPQTSNVGPQTDP